MALRRPLLGAAALLTLLLVLRLSYAPIADVTLQTLNKGRFHPSAELFDDDGPAADLDTHRRPGKAIGNEENADIELHVPPPVDQLEFGLNRQKSDVRGAFVILVRNSELGDILSSIRQMEDRFNHAHRYPYVFINDEPFTEHFKEQIEGVVSGEAHFGLTQPGTFEPPPWIDEKKAKAGREKLTKLEVLYGDSVSYRNMCRYQSGWFQHHPLLANFDYYWRIEPGVKFFCDMTGDRDPFRVMSDNNYKYGFTLSLYEYGETIPTLWDTTKEFFEKRPELLAKGNAMEWLSDDNGDSYNNCHFWSNFEIGSLEFMRSQAYTDFFNHLDRAGGFSYERWGDAPVHSIAAGLMLPMDQVHWFGDIGYRHEPWQHCPSGALEDPKRCWCDPEDSFEHDGYSCTDRWNKIVNRRKVFAPHR